MKSINYLSLLFISFICILVSASCNPLNSDSGEGIVGQFYAYPEKGYSGIAAEAAKAWADDTNKQILKYLPQKYNQFTEENKTKVYNACLDVLETYYGKKYKNATWVGNGQSYDQLVVLEVGWIVDWNNPSADVAPNKWVIAHSLGLRYDH